MKAYNFDMMKCAPILAQEREKIMKVSKHFRLNANEIEDIYDIFEGEK